MDSFAFLQQPSNCCLYQHTRIDVRRRKACIDRTNQYQTKGSVVPLGRVTGPAFRVPDGVWSLPPIDGYCLLRLESTLPKRFPCSVLRTSVWPLALQMLKLCGDTLQCTEHYSVVTRHGEDLCLSILCTRVRFCHHHASPSPHHGFF